MSIHSNRRTWATKLDKAGVRLKTIQDLGGWTSMAALQRYLEVSEEEKADNDIEVVNMDRFTK